MPWTDDFKDFLQRSSDTAVDRTYAPQFRLQIGTPLISGSHMGSWERESGTKCLEISSHPNCCSLSTAFGTESPIFKRTATDTGHAFMYCVGLTGEINLGKQSVNPRTYMYTPQNLRIGVTQFAGNAAQELQLGTLACLQILVDTFDDSRPAEWQNIFFGSYKGMEWNGQRYTLTFDDALANAKHHSTANAAYTDDNKDKKRHFWFNGLGSVTTIQGTVTDFTDSTVVTDQIFEHYLERDATNWGYAYRQPVDAYKWDYGYSSSTSTRSNWAKVKNAAGNETWVYYASVGIKSGDTELELRGVYSSSSFAHHLPGFDGLAAEDVTGGLGDESTLTNVLVISGTPVTEFVNTVYVQGYHELMVPGIFGKYGTVYREDCLNWEDINLASDRFDAQYLNTTGRSSSADSPFRFIVSAPVANGLALMNKSCGKWGVFPRFKEGGYGMAINPPDVYAARDYVALNDVIDMTHIEGADFSMRNLQMTGSYRTGKIVSTAKDNGLEGNPKEVDSTITTATDYSWSTSWTMFGHYQADAPIFGEITVTTADCAEGFADGVASRYKAYISDIQRRLYSMRHKSATLRLNGFRFAHLAPGDFVDVKYTESSDYPNPHDWGPYDSEQASSLATLTYKEGFEALTRNDEPWMVVGIQVDWVRCLVTVDLAKHVESRSDSAYTNKWSNEAWGKEQHRAESILMGMPIPKKRS